MSNTTIQPWAGRHRSSYYQRVLEGVAATYGFSMDLPFRRLSKKALKLVLEGTGDEPITVSYLNRFGRQRRYQTNYEGLIPWLVRRHEGADSESAREAYEQYMRLVPCDACGGALVQRKDDSEEVLRERLQVYRRQTEPLIERYSKLGWYREVDGERTIDDIYRQIADVVRAQVASVIA